jgi:uncharacterized membrane protein
MLSDDTKLKEKIIDVANNERNGLLVILLGSFLAFAGLIFGVLVNSALAFFGGIFVSALGVFSTFFGFYVTVRSAHQYNDLLRELESKQ